MDIGKFKASRARLILWVLIPPSLVVGAGLSSHALRAQSEWQLNRTRALAEVFPKLVIARRNAERLMAEFNGTESSSLKSEDELISYLQSAARKVDFTVDSLKVERRSSPSADNAPMLTASVKGTGGFGAIQHFLGDVSAGQHLLSESYLQLSRSSAAASPEECRADITFELILFNAGNTPAGGF